MRQEGWLLIIMPGQQVGMRTILGKPGQSPFLSVAPAYLFMATLSIIYNTEEKMDQFGAKVIV